MNTVIKGQTYNRITSNEWSYPVVTIPYVGIDYFTFKEDVEQNSWTFDLLSDKYVLVGEQ